MMAIFRNPNEVMLYRPMRSRTEHGDVVKTNQHTSYVLALHQ